MTYTAEDSLALTNHYKAMSWIVYNQNLNKNKHLQNIAHKIKTLQEHGLDQDAVLSELWFRYQDREHFLKYDYNKSALTTFICAWVDLELNNIRRILTRKWRSDDMLDKINEYNYNNVDEMGHTNDDNVFIPSELIDNDTPEGYVIMKEIMTLAKNFFSDMEWKYMVGEIDLISFSRYEGISPTAALKRIQRKNHDFKTLIKNS